MGAFVGEVDFDDLEANLIFAVLFLWRSISMTLRQIYFCSALHVEVDFGDLEANLIFTVRLLQRGRFL